MKVKKAGCGKEECDCGCEKYKKGKKPCGSCPVMEGLSKKKRRKKNSGAAVG